MQHMGQDSAGMKDPEADRGEVFHEINAMTIALDMLEGYVNKLQDRLNPIVSKRSEVETSPEESEIESEKPTPAGCPLSEQMRGHRTRLNRLGPILDSLRKSLEL